MGAVSGSFGVQLASRDFEAIGEEAFVPPTETRSFAAFAFEEVGRGTWRGQLGARYEHQNVEALGDVGLERSFDAFSGSAGVLYRGDSGFGAALTLALSEKVPNAEELYSNGPHLATGVFEVGDPDLVKEKSFGVDLSVNKRVGSADGPARRVPEPLRRLHLRELSPGEEEDGLPVAQYVQGDAPSGASRRGRDRARSTPSPATSTWSCRPTTCAPACAAATSRRCRGSRRSATGRRCTTATRTSTAASRCAARPRRSASASSSCPTDGYTFLNASLGYRFFVGHRILQLRVQATNLTDAEGRNHVSFLKDVAPLPGRDFRGSVRVTVLAATSGREPGPDDAVPLSARRGSRKPWWCR